MKIYKVSMPLVGLIPFLLMARRRPHNGTRVCQCPWSGLSHFYKRFYLTLVFVLAVSMPLVGLIPFLPTTTLRIQLPALSVSMPLVGLIPFLRVRPPLQSTQEIQVSMPLVRLIPFLLHLGGRIYARYVCQCPWSGLSHFYQQRKREPSSCLRLCQCPWSGLSHFYFNIAYNYYSTWMCVNALGRAYPISTVSLPKPFKINGFRVRFQGVIVRKF